MLLLGADLAHELDLVVHCDDVLAGGLQFHVDALSLVEQPAPGQPAAVVYTNPPLGYPRDISRRTPPSSVLNCVLKGVFKWMFLLRGCS